jgi:hypothetical protein
VHEEASKVPFEERPRRSPASGWNTHTRTPSQTDDKQATCRGGAQEGIYLSSGDVGMAMENAPTVVFTFVCSPPPPAAVLLGNGPGGGVGNGTPGGLGGGGVAGVVYTGFAEVSMLVLRVGSFVGRYTNYWGAGNASQIPVPRSICTIVSTLVAATVQGVPCG